MFGYIFNTTQNIFSQCIVSLSTGTALSPFKLHMQFQNCCLNVNVSSLPVEIIYTHNRFRYECVHTFLALLTFCEHICYVRDIECSKWMFVWHKTSKHTRSHIHTGMCQLKFDESSVRFFFLLNFIEIWQINTDYDQIEFKLKLLVW